MLSIADCRKPKDSLFSPAPLQNVLYANTPHKPHELVLITLRTLVPPEVEASFITIIDSILAASDLDTISEKRIRKGIQASVEYDITPQKACPCACKLMRQSLIPNQRIIKALIMERFDKFDARRKRAAEANTEPNGTVLPSIETSTDTVDKDQPPPPVLNKQKRKSDDDHTSATKTPSSTKHLKEESDEDELSDIKDTPPPKKKKKVADHDSDAAFAAKLQAQENSRIRSTRGGGSKPTPAKKKRTPKKKTAAKVKADDDSDLDGSGSEVKEKKVNKNNGFHVSSAPS